MPELEQIALRFPVGTRDRLKSLATPGETMTATFLRALDRLSEPTAKREEESSLIADLITRVDALERQLVGSNLNGETATHATTGDGRHYSAPERALAVMLDKQGRRPVEIRRILQAEFGRAPSASSMRRQLRQWQADLTEPG